MYIYNTFVPFSFMFNLVGLVGCVILGVRYLIKRDFDTASIFLLVGMWMLIATFNNTCVGKVDGFYCVSF